MSTPEFRTAAKFGKQWVGWAIFAGLALGCICWLLIGCGQGLASPTVWQGEQPPGLESWVRFVFLPAGIWAGLMTTMLRREELLFLVSRPCDVRRLLLARAVVSLGLLGLVVAPFEVAMLFSSFDGDFILPAVVPHGLAFVGFGVGILVGRSINDELIGFLVALLLVGVAAACVFAKATDLGLHPALSAAGDASDDVALAFGLMGLGPAAILLKRDASPGPSQLVAALGVFVVLSGWCLTRVSVEIGYRVGDADSLQRVAVVGMNRRGPIVALGLRDSDEKEVYKFAVVHEDDARILRVIAPTSIRRVVEHVVVGSNRRMGILTRSHLDQRARWMPRVDFFGVDHNMLAGGEDVHGTASLLLGVEDTLLFVATSGQGTRVRPLKHPWCSGAIRRFDGNVSALGWAGDDMVLAQDIGVRARLLRASPAWSCSDTREGRDASDVPGEVEVLAERPSGTIFRLSPDGTRWVEATKRGPGIEVFPVVEGKQSRVEFEVSGEYTYVEHSLNWFDNEQLYIVERDASGHHRYTIVEMDGAVRHIETLITGIPATIAGTLGRTLILTRGMDVGLLRPGQREVQFVRTLAFGQRQSANFGVSDTAVHYVDEYGRLEQLTEEGGAP